jgi:hypothetical protein
MCRCVSSQRSEDTTEVGGAGVALRAPAWGGRCVTRSFFISGHTSRMTLLLLLLLLYLAGSSFEPFFAFVKPPQCCTYKFVWYVKLLAWRCCSHHIPHYDHQFPDHHACRFIVLSHLNRDLVSPHALLVRRLHNHSLKFLQNRRTRKKIRPTTRRVLTCGAASPLHVARKRLVSTLEAEM